MTTDVISPPPVLLIGGDAWHPESVYAGAVSEEAANGAEVRLVHGFDAGMSALARHRLVVLAKSNQASPADERPWFTEDHGAELLDFVARGGGLLVLHAGIALYENVESFRSLVGGVFTEHDEQCPVTAEPDGSHPVTAAVEPYEETDEHYFVEMTAADADVLMVTRSKYGVQPGCWIRSEGRGRVCVATPGHTGAVWANPNHRRLIRNAALWVQGCPGPDR